MRNPWHAAGGGEEGGGGEGGSNGGLKGGNGGVVYPKIWYASPLYNIYDNGMSFKKSRFT